MEEQGSDVTFLFQFGLLRDTVTIPRDLLNLKTIKDLASDFVNAKIPDHSINRINDRILLFRHDYSSSNVLQLLNSPLQITDETIIEIVLTGKISLTVPDKTIIRPHALNVHSFKVPTFCDFCGEMLFGLVRQGLKCEGCGNNYHKRCVVKVPNNCSYVLLDNKHKKKASTLQVPRSPSGGSNSSSNSGNTEENSLIKIQNFFSETFNIKD